MPSLSRIRSDQHAELDDASIGIWFRRASRLVGSINSGCITIDEATDALLATIRSASDVRSLRRGAWDAETLLGADAPLNLLLQGAVDRVAEARMRTS